MQHVTIKDIAKHLGISVSTVSRALNDKYDVNAKTREQVLETAQKLGYHPNPIARKLIQKRSQNIGIVVPEFVNSFFPQVIIGVQEILLEQGFQVLIMQSNECHETELKNIRNLLDNMVDGLIVSLSRETKNISFYKELAQSGFPIVFFNRTNEEIPAPAVVFDDYKWAFFATEHLIIQGYRNIFHFTVDSHLSINRKRIEGFRDAHKKYGINIKPEQIQEAGLTMAEGEKLMSRLLESDNVPDAIFGNDPVVVGAMKAIQRKGIKIPSEIGVVGFTESRLAEAVTPSLTSVSQPTQEMGRFTANLLLQRINNPELPYETMVFNGKLNIRNSSLKNVELATE